MDEYRDAFRDGWNAALEEMERRCSRMWHQNGDTVQGVTNVDLVWMRFPTEKKEEVQS